MLGIASNAPGGLGVFEATMLKALADRARPSCLRFFYFGRSTI